MRNEPWDWPEEPEKPSRRPRIETFEILPPRQLEREQRIRVNAIVHHRRPNMVPQVMIVDAFIFVPLILFRAPGALLMLAALTPSKIWIACGFAGAAVGNYWS
jgi:hypothetical protein